MKKLLLLLTLSVTFLGTKSNAQIFYSEGANISIKSGGLVHCNGGFFLESASTLTNDGQLTTTKNSILTEAGNFKIGTNSSSSGNGTYRIEQNWINDGQFNGNNSTVLLYGNTEQLITSTNGTTTEFNNLTLQGNGTGLNRRKTLFAVDAAVGTNGTLTINDRELSTQEFTFTVLNDATNAVNNSTSFGNEGFVSSSEPGYFVRYTNGTQTYDFPLGSSDGTLRYRPAKISAEYSGNNVFGARLNNYNADLDGFPLAQHDADIETANSLFYHSIEQLAGSSNAKIAVSYLSDTDGQWFNLANWEPSNSLWANMGDVTELNSGNYTFVERSSWNTDSKYHPYILVTIGDELTVPNVFTPNGDGVNDVFFVNSKGITEYNITIVNRWGNPVFESTDVNASWDGTSDGKKCVDGTYFYILKAKSNTKDYLKQGHVTLNGN
jgi:gliding motility-associated-like protein